MSALNSPPFLFQNRITLNNDQIKALNVQGTILVPSPGPRKIIVPLSLSFWRSVTTAAYSSTDTNGVFLSYTPDFSDSGVIGSPIPYFAFADGNVGIGFWHLQMNETGNYSSSATFIDKPVYLYQGAAFTGGNAANLVRITCAYLIFDTETGLYVSEDN